MTWPTLWWMLNLVVLVWSLSIRLMNLLTSGQWSVLLLNNTFTQGLFTIFSDQAIADFEHGLDVILTDPIQTQELDASLMSLIPCHLQSLQGSYTWVVPFLIILNCSLLLTSSLICSSHFGYSSACFSHQNCTCWYNHLSTGLCQRDSSFKSA